MTALELLVVGLAGGGGALLRHELTTGRPLSALHAVNVVGSLVLGVVLGVAATSDGDGVATLVAVAGLGGLTSFSSWVVGVRALERRGTGTTGTSGGPGVVTGHVVLPAVLAVAAAALGAFVGSVGLDVVTAVGP